MQKNLFKTMCFLMLISGNSLFAQEKSSKIKDHLKVSFDIGYSSSNLKANLSSYVNSNYVPGNGIGMNLNAEYIFFQKYIVSSGISYLQRNYRFERDGAYAGWYSNYKQNYISVPLMLGGYVLNRPGKDKGIWIKLAGGVYGDYLIDRHTEGQYPLLSTLNLDGTFDYGKVSEPYDFKENRNHLARFGYGLQGQAQAGYNFKQFEKRWDVYGAFNYQYGLSDVDNYKKSDAKKNTNVSYIISLGLSYKF